MKEEKIVMESAAIGGLLKSLSRRLGMNMKHLLAELNVTPTQMEMLGFLKSRQDVETCQGDVQNALVLTNPAVTKLVQQLSGRNLISVTVNERDQRVRNLNITEEGLRLLDECDRRKTPEQLNALKGFSLEEIRNLNDYLTRLISNVQ